jgi:hypothetical protein
VEQYGHDGVAVCSRYGLLKAALDGLLDEASLGLVRYGTGHLENTFSTIQFITTKQADYSAECEVRAWLTVYDPLASGNRHFDLDNFPHPVPLEINPRHSWVPDCKRRRIDLRSLITNVIVSPWAEADAVEDIEIWVKAKGFPASSTPSALRGDHTPTLEEFRRVRHLAGGGTPEPATADEVPATREDLDRLYEVLASLTPSRVRWLYRQRWEICRLNPGQLPRVADLQHLETTLKVLEDWRRQGIDVG